MSDLGGPSDQHVHSVNDTPLISKIKDNDQPTVWLDRPRNRYEPE